MGTTTRPPKWIKPQLTRLVDEAPTGNDWLHEIKYDGYHTDDGRLHYAGRAGTGITDKELKRLAGVLKHLHVPRMPLAEPPPRDSRFGSPLQLSRVHWVRPEVVVEVTYLTWTEDNLLRQVSYQGQREDKPAKQVVRRVPQPARRTSA